MILVPTLCVETPPSDASRPSPTAPALDIVLDNVYNCYYTLHAPKTRLRHLHQALLTHNLNSPKPY